MLFIVQRWHSCRNHLALEACKAPRLGCKLYDSLHSNFDTFLFLRVRKVFDRVDDLFNDGTGGSVDALFSTTARKCSEERLLTPYRFFARALIADVVAHRKKQGVSLVVTATETEQEGAKNTVCDQLRYRMCYICSTDLPVVILG